MPNGLKLNWGAVRCDTFSKDSDSGGYARTVQLAVACPSWRIAAVCPQFAGGFPRASHSDHGASSIKLLCDVGSSSVFVNYVTVGM